MKQRSALECEVRRPFITRIAGKDKTEQTSAENAGRPRCSTTDEGSRSPSDSHKNHVSQAAARLRCRKRVGNPYLKRAAFGQFDFAKNQSYASPTRSRRSLNRFNPAMQSTAFG